MDQEVRTLVKAGSQVLASWSEAEAHLPDHIDAGCAAVGRASLARSEPLRSGIWIGDPGSAVRHKGGEATDGQGVACRAWAGSVETGNALEFT